MRKMFALLLVFAMGSPALADRAAREAQRAADIQAGEAELAKLTKGLVPGKPETCAPNDRWSGSHNIDRIGILYEYGGLRYLNRMDPECASFQYNDIPVIVSHGMTCRGDIVRIVDNTGLFKGTCTLGDFIPYAKPKD